MKNSVEFTFYLEKESAISQLNRFMLKEFGCKTHLWSDEASHNIILWLLRGSVRYFDEQRNVAIEMSRKVISIKRGSSYVIEAEADSLLLTYSFDDYLPFDTESLKCVDTDRITQTTTPLYVDLHPSIYYELESVISTISTLSGNEALTFISLQKVMLSMQRSCGKERLRHIFAPLLSRKNEEMAKYARLIKFNEKNFKKSAFAYNLKV